MWTETGQVRELQVWGGEGPTQVKKEKLLVGLNPHPATFLTVFNSPSTAPHQIKRALVSSTWVVMRTAITTHMYHGPTVCQTHFTHLNSLLTTTSRGSINFIPTLPMKWRKFLYQ